MPAMATTPITTGAAMAATGTELLELLACGEGEPVTDADVARVEDGAAVMTTVAGAVLFCWSEGVQYAVVSEVCETYTTPTLCFARSSC